MSLKSGPVELVCGKFVKGVLKNKVSNWLPVYSSFLKKKNPYVYLKYIMYPSHEISCGYARVSKYMTFDVKTIGE
jgi:hypothetical protein